MEEKDIVHEIKFIRGTEQTLNFDIKDYTHKGIFPVEWKLVNDKGKIIIRRNINLLKNKNKFTISLCSTDTENLKGYYTQRIFFNDKSAVLGYIEILDKVKI
jgi:hypothetical protein